MRLSLLEQVRACFLAQGPLAGAVTAFSPREGQLDMALAVAQAIEDDAQLVVEAGTGIGKTYAYLVPALLSGERVLISTATKTLQDQLFARDLPRLVQALALPLRLALLKGRSSYLCQYRLAQARQSLDLQDPRDLDQLARIEHWALSTRSGDLAELAGVHEQSKVIPLVTSSRDNCLGGHCPQAKSCHVNLARREALAADVLVINHHLFFADMGVRESGVAELLPNVRVAIFDEAHQLNSIGIQFLGRQLGTGQVLDYSRDLLATGQSLARGWIDWRALAGKLELSARHLRLTAQHVPSGSKLGWSAQAPQDLDAAAWREALGALGWALGDCVEQLDRVTEVAPDFIRLRERAQEMLQGVTHFEQAREADTVRWLDVGFQLRLVESPLEIAHTMTACLQPRSEPTPDAGASPARRSWIFTSATLGTDPGLRWFTQPCGLSQARVLRIDSPFDYARQAAVHVPPGLPRPNEAQHSEKLAEWALPRVVRLGGRTLLLTTTLKALRTIAQVMRWQLQQQASSIEVLEQGQATKRELIARFEQAAQGEAGCVLVASASFWEGVDIPGDALRLVILDKLPFPPPGDPLTQARTQRLEAQGQNAFSAYFVAEAAVALKQGAGRLIRRETDQGLLVIGDTRLGSMAYGKRLLAALPPMRRLVQTSDFDQALAALTTASTTADRQP